MTTAAVVGIGDISTIHLQAIAENDQVELVGVCDIVPERAEQAAQQWGVPAFTDHQQLLEQARPEVVHITLPHHLHVPVALDVLAAGAHVLTEKPLGHTYQSAQRLADAARSAAPKLGVCFQNRYNPTSVALQQALAGGEYGAV
ncbi:MAG: Gfo/Idh/MocA family oxidoreductase, partial [Actinomycetia bacterium]|nr:Gfo/Idh/MocA family oxidoreductase [Actinomycetes bacterium]